MSTAPAAALLAALALSTAACIEPARDAEHPASVADSGPPARFTLHVLDVGTGLALLVRGEDFNLLYDGGSNDDRKTGPENRLLAYLSLLLGPSAEAECVSASSVPAPGAAARIDHLFLSHPHRDHLELLPDVLRCYQVANVWESGQTADTATYARFVDAVEAEVGVQRHHATNPASGLRAGGSIPLGRQAEAFVLSADASAKDPNDASIVLRLDLGKARVLFTGDATAGERRDPSAPPDRGSVEERLLREMPAELAADVLVVGHHGSRTSTRGAFLEAVNPQTAIISSGPMAYGRVVLPDAEIVALLANRARVLRTDEDDEGCRQAERKVGVDADGAPGGCSAFTIAIEGGEFAITAGPAAD